MAALGKIALGNLRLTSPVFSSFGDFQKVGEPSQRLQRIAFSSPTGKSEKILAPELQRGTGIDSLLERGERVEREGRRERRHMEMKASGVTGNGVAITDDVATNFTGERVATVSRKTKETDVTVTIGLDGTGICKCDTGIPFLDHMIDQLASHGLFDVAISAKGDIHIDDHHTNEDIALALGTALAQALGDRKGIHRFGDFSAPLDEALIHVVLDLSGRPHLSYDLVIPTDRVGTYDTQLVEHFFQSLANNSGMTLHIRQLAGKNSHHIIEATFKAFARALRRATEQDPRRSGSVPSSKGVLTQS